jgi:chromosome partitioning protein
MAHDKLGPVVAVLNMKGGVGKTTISSNVFRVFYHRRKISTLLVDLDPQFNLTQAVTSRAMYDRLRKEGKTILAAMEPSSDLGLFDIAVSTAPPPQARDIAHGLRHFPTANPPITLDLIPGDFRLVKYSLVADQDKLKAAHERFCRFIAEARREYGLVCIDCNPSSSFITSCALHACTHLLVPVRPDKYSILGLEILADFLDQIPTIYPKPGIIVVLNGIPRQGYDRKIENELRAHQAFGAKVLASSLHLSRILEARSDYTGFATDKGAPHTKKLVTEIRALVDELAKGLGT